LAGEFYEVRVLISTGTDVHHYEPKPQDLRNLKEAKYIFSPGLGKLGEKTARAKGKALPSQSKPAINIQ
jgi:ABC-type Zn uptake system ZnuABC Zn-binding protein ZnuA